MGVIPTQHKGLPEIFESVQSGEDGDHQQLWPQHGQGDLREPRPLPRPIHTGAFIQLAGDGGEARQQDDHPNAHILPEIQPQEDDEGKGGIHPRGGAGQLAQEAVLRKDEIDHDHNGGRRQHHGKQQGHSQPFSPLARLLQQQGEKQRQGQDERQAAGQEQKGVFQRQQEQPVPEKLGVILHPHKPSPSQTGGERAEKRIAKGQHQKGQQAHHRGSCQQQSDGCLSPFHSATSVSSCCSKSWATFSTSSVLGV